MVLCVKLLKFVADIISVPLAHAFNLSLESGIFPTKLKQSKLNLWFAIPNVNIDWHAEPYM
jgi:hypothetical protein